MKLKNGYLNVSDIAFFHPGKVLFLYLLQPYNSESLDSKVVYKTFATVSMHVTICFKSRNLFVG